MESYERIMIGIVLFVVTSVVAYLFKMRQLYAVSPNLYKTTPISDDGSLYELFIYNRGNNVEEEILLEIDPSLRGELLASNISNLKFDGSKITLDRLHKGKEASALLLIERGKFDSSSIVSISSKQTTGKSFNKKEDIPPNYASLFLHIVFLVGIVPSFMYGFKLYEYIEDSYLKSKLKPLYEQGWNNLSRYYDSELRESYSSQEFPARFNKLIVNDNKASRIVFDIFNKSAIPLEVTIDRIQETDGDYSYFESIEVEPMSKDQLTTQYDSDIKGYEFKFSHGDDFIYEIFYLPRHLTN